MIVLRQQRGLRRARQVDTVEAAVFGACDRSSMTGQTSPRLAQLLERDPADLAADYLPAVPTWCARAS